MIVEVLATSLGARMRVGIIAPAKDSSIGNILWKQITEPVYAIGRSPSLVSMTVESMDGDDTLQRRQSWTRTQR